MLKSGTKNSHRLKRKMIELSCPGESEPDLSKVFDVSERSTYRWEEQRVSHCEISKNENATKKHTEERKAVAKKEHRELSSREISIKIREASVTIKIRDDQLPIKAPCKF